MYKISLERIIYVGVIFLLLVNLFNSNKVAPKEKEISVVIKRDTIWKTKVDTFKIETIKYETVYVRKNNVLDILKDSIFPIDTVRYEAAKMYRDTLSNSEIEIYSYNLVRGKLLDSNLSYKFKSPEKIEVTKTITHPKTYRSGLYLFTEGGGNSTKFDNVSLGLQYNRKGKWFISYRLQVNQIMEPTHNVGVGFRLFN